MTITLDQQEWDKLPALDAFAEGSKTPGDLAHAMRVAQVLIKKYQKYTYLIQVTGKLRKMHPNGYNTLEIIAYSKPVKDLVGDKIQGANQLTNALAASKKFAINAEMQQHKHIDMLHKDRLLTKDYQIYITHITNKHQLPVAQIILSSSSEFADAMTRTELPWGYSIKDARLQPPNGKPPLTPSENAYFNVLGYEFIPVRTRQCIEPWQWQDYKREGNE